MTKEGTVLDGKYEILAEVGRGGMSIVYLARDKRLNKQWAVKEIKNDGKKSAKTLLKGLEREANILKNVDHPVLPRIVYIINQDGTIYVVWITSKVIRFRTASKSKALIRRNSRSRTTRIQLHLVREDMQRRNSLVIQKDAVSIIRMPEPIFIIWAQPCTKT